MKIGTRSIVFGAHCFFLHPWFVAWGWWRLYGFRKVSCPSTGVRTSLLDWHLWLCFIVHDLGYWGKPNMDGNEGEVHPYWGANIVQRILLISAHRHKWPSAVMTQDESTAYRWRQFALLHSRFLARSLEKEPSLLCWADKMAITLTPSWLYIPMTKLTGELNEYMNVNPREIKGSVYGSARAWHQACRAYCEALAIEHKDGRADTWTPKKGE